MALGFWHQGEHHATRVEAGVLPVDPNEGGELFDLGLEQESLRQGLLASRHGPKRRGLRGLGEDLDGPGVLLRKEALVAHHIQDCSECQGAQKHPPGEAGVIEHPGELAAIAGNQGVDPGPHLRSKRRGLGVLMGLQNARAHHGSEREGHHRRDQNGHRQRDGKLMKKPPHHVAHEEERDQDGDQGEGERDNGEPDFLGP